MRCPSCRAPLAQPVPQCPQCKLTLRRLDTRFGAVPKHSRFVTDRSASLPLRDIAELRALLELFHRKFPQSLFSVFVMPSIDGGTISEYIFWLANRARFSAVEARPSDNFDALLVIDLQTQTAALQVGYGLENYLAELDLERALAQASPAFAAGEFAHGVRACVEFLMNRMRKASRHGAEEKGKPARAAASPMDW